jgi:hypothetical protein
VICARNHRRSPYIYATKAAGDKEFLANGEIGMVIGQKQWGKKNPSFTHIEFAGRDDRNFSLYTEDAGKKVVHFFEAH